MRGSGANDDSLDVWFVPLDNEPSHEIQLSADELERASRFRFPVHRQRFLAARRALRQVLGWWTETPPSRVSIGYGANGKPLLQGDTVRHFNVSHSEDLAVIALSFGAVVGVDLEMIRPIDDIESMLRIVFSEAERTRPELIDHSSREQTFFRGWTRKEAYLKAIGVGLSVSLHAVTVDLDPIFPRLLDLDGAHDPHQWTLLNLAPRVDCVGALAVERPAATMRVHDELPR